jgi:hypothetical protein
MAITQSMANSFKVEILQGVHAFGPAPIRASTSADQFRIALYQTGSTLDATVTAYGSTPGAVEVTQTPASSTYIPNSTNNNLTVSTAPVIGNASTSGGTSYLSFSNISWTLATIAADGALIYNTSQSNKAVAILDFGGTKSSTIGTFQITFPASAYNTAIIRIGS